MSVECLILLLYRVAGIFTLCQDRMVVSPSLLPTHWPRWLPLTHLNTLTARRTGLPAKSNGVAASLQWPGTLEPSSKVCTGVVRQAVLVDCSELPA